MRYLIFLAKTITESTKPSKRMKSIKKVLYSGLVVSLLSFQVKAQAPFQEGVLTYKADTIRRLAPEPAAYIPSRVLVYKKGDLLRLEIWRIGKNNPADVQKDIRIRNRKGVYQLMEVSDPMIAPFANTMALFMSYDEETQVKDKQALAGGRKSYRLDKVIQKTTWLGLPAEKVALSEGPIPEPTEAIITRAMTLPISTLFDFDPLGDLPGTPLQFTVSELGWMTRLTATQLKAQPVPDALFEIDPKRNVMSLAEADKVLDGFK